MIDEKDNSTKRYIHVIKIDGSSRYRVYEHNLRSKGTFDDEKSAVKIAKKMQIKNKQVVLLHSENGDVIRTYYPKIQAISLSDDGAPKRKTKRSSSPRALVTKHG